MDMEKIHQSSAEQTKSMRLTLVSDKLKVHRKRLLGKSHFIICETLLVVFLYNSAGHRISSCDKNDPHSKI